MIQLSLSIVTVLVDLGILKPVSNDFCLMRRISRQVDHQLMHAPSIELTTDRSLLSFSLLHAKNLIVVV